VTPAGSATRWPLCLGKGGGHTCRVDCPAGGLARGHGGDEVVIIDNPGRCWGGRLQRIKQAWCRGERCQTSLSERERCAGGLCECRGTGVCDRQLKLLTEIGVGSTTVEAPIGGDHFVPVVCFPHFEGRHYGQVTTDTFG